VSGRTSRLWPAVAVAILLVASSATGALAQASPEASTAPQESVAPGSTEAPAESAGNPDPCAPFRQERSIGVISSRAVVGQSAAQTDPTATNPYACRLPSWDPGAAWPYPGKVDAANAFRWSDAADEATDPQGDIAAVSWVPIRLTRGDATRIRRSKDFLTLGGENKAIRPGRYLLVQIETAEKPASAPGRTLLVHVGADADGESANNAPTSVDNPSSPYQDLQNMYSVAFVDGRAPALYATDFAGPADANGSTWYNDGDKRAFAARVLGDTPGVQFLMPDKAIGASFRPVIDNVPTASGRRSALVASLVGADQPASRTVDQEVTLPTGSDFAAIGSRLGLFPKGGVASGLVGCISADVLHEPVALDTLDDGLGNVTDPATMPSGTPVIVCVWPTFADLDEITDWFERADFENDDLNEVEVTMRVQEKGIEQIQWTRARLTLRGGNLYVGWVIGLSAFGHHDLRTLGFKPTGNEVVDRVLKDSASVTLGALPPWSVGEPEGLVAGEDGCAPPDVADILTPPR
jgi:hypothetical protein